MGQGRGRTGRRGRANRFPRWRRPPLADLLALIPLAVVTAGLLIYAGLQPPTRLVFTPGQEPPTVALTGFYDPERNDAFAFRWSKPRAVLAIRVAAPAEYRVSLAMQDNPAVDPPRTATVAINGAEARAVVLDRALREYVFQHHLRAHDRQPDNSLTLEIAIETSPFVPPAAPRALGVVVARVAVEPVHPPPWWQPALLVPNLLLLLVAYGALRLLGLRVPVVAGASGLLLAACALLTVGARADALALASEASIYPLGFLGVVLFLAAAPLIARAPSARTEGSSPPAPWPPRASREDLVRALWLFVTLRVAFSTFALLASVLFPLDAPCSWEGGPALHTAGLPFRLLGVWQRWDACYYQQIATLGYGPLDPTVTFFPLYSLLMRVVSVPVGGDLTLSGLIISGIAYIAAMVGLYRLVALDFDREVAGRTVLYLSVFPSAFFLFAPFSEALFLALAVWTLYAARRGAWGWAGVAGLLVGFTRLQGSLLALPLAWEWFCQWRGRWPPAGEQGREGKGREKARPRHLAALIVPLLPLCSLAAFTLYSKLVTGLTPLGVQPWWRVTTHTPWGVIALSWRSLRARGDAIQALNLALLVLFALLLVAGLRRLPLVYSLYVAPQLLLIGIRTNFVPLNSTSRYLLVLFPAMVLLALLGRRERLHLSWLIASLLLLGLLLYTFLSGKFVA